MEERFVKIMEELFQHGAVTETQVIHTKIKADFFQLKQSTRIEKIEEILAEKYCLEPGSIHQIIYKKVKRV